MEFTIKDVLKKAVEMEDAGKIFYEYASAIVDNKDIKKVLNILATEEIGHKHIFENMLNRIDEIKTDNVSNKEYLQYLNDHISIKSVFDRKKFEENKDKLKSIIDIIDYAIDREMDSVLYYMMMMAVVREEQNFLVQKIIEEEKKHFIKLNEAKNLILRR